MRRSKLSGAFAWSGLVALALIGTAGCAAQSAGDESEIVETQSGLTFTGLTLVNGWTNAPFSTRNAASALSSGIVYLRGAIATTGTNAFPFTLPVGRRPSTSVYVPVNLCGATKGRLFIPTTGAVQVVAENGTFSNAQCFTSLEGVSFAVSTAGFTPLTLVNGWTNAPFSTRNAAVINIGDTIHFQGAIASGSSAMAFTLPIGFAPSTNAYLPLDLCDGTKGRIFIDIGGAASIVAENGTFTNAQCFTSLEGVSYGLNPASGSGYTCLSAINGWTGMPFSTRNPCVKNDNGIIRLLGSVATSTGATGPVIQLPVGMRPPTNTYVEADLFGGTQGRVLIQSTGFVSAQSEGPFSNAQGFTSLEGVLFSL